MTSIENTPATPVDAKAPPFEHRPFSDPSRLAPEDAFLAPTPPRRQSELKNDLAIHHGDNIGTGLLKGSRRRKDRDRRRSGSRRPRPGVWKKLLWVQQSYPDNYTDPPTFLEQLQWNPRLLPYDFWPLVADFTGIVQHICSVAIFICSFVGIYLERLSPVSVLSWGSVGAVLGWLAWDFWIGEEEAAKALSENTYAANTTNGAPEEGSSNDSVFSMGNGQSEGQDKSTLGLGIGLSNNNQPSSRSHSRNVSASSLQSDVSASSPISAGHPTGAPQLANYSQCPPYNALAPSFSARNQQRLATAKSAVLIYCALLGLSPLLKSLTKSTSSDSIWAMSCWLMCTNVFFFDYGGGVGVKFPASLSTNAALMASTVLASRLPSTTHVFSLTLFSIEVFGLFPVFRRHLRHRSWQLHILLTVFLVTGAGAGMGVTLVKDGGWKAAVAGTILWSLGTMIGMGGCSWWLIGLQKYKNVVIGPWDPARPIIRGGWD